MITLSKAQIASYHAEGYLVVETGLAPATLDAVVENLAAYWGQERPNGVTYADENRIQDAWRISDNARVLATFPAILGMLEALYGNQPLPFQTLNFPRGTEQKAHADSIHFNSEPFGSMCGVWIALEDIGADQGPLVYYPGSHLLPEMNFEDIGLRPDYANYPQYEIYIEHLIAERLLEPVYGTIDQGQAIIWSANVLHGGATQRDKSRSRHSQVTHYYFAGCKYWRPGLSRRRRHYFEPHWIPCHGGLRTSKPVASALRAKHTVVNRLWNAL